MPTAPLEITPTWRVSKSAAAPDDCSVCHPTKYFLHRQASSEFLYQLEKFS
jgi:hypothetical protein